MEKDASNGLVVIDMLANIIMINGKAKAPWHGLMAQYTKEIGREVFSMDMVKWHWVMGLLNKATLIIIYLRETLWRYKVRVAVLSHSIRPMLILRKCNISNYLQKILGWIHLLEPVHLLLREISHRRLKKTISQGCQNQEGH